MTPDSRILVTGASGLVGSAIVNHLLQKGYKNLSGTYHRRKADFDPAVPLYPIDFRDQQAVAALFDKVRPEYVFLAAARVGGIMANNTYRADFIHDNLLNHINIIHQSYLAGVKKMLYLGSTCIYPRDCPQPIKEEYLLTSPLEYTNEPYAISKIAGLKMCESFNLQYGTNYICAMPTNLYGPGDNFDLEKAHVLPAMMRKMHLGKCLATGDWVGLRADLNARPVNGTDGSASENRILQTLEKHGIRRQRSVVGGQKSEVGGRKSEVGGRRSEGGDRRSENGQEATSECTLEIWGTGKPLREFLWSLDMAEACVFLMERVDFADLAKGMKEVRNTHINIGSGQEISIRDLALTVKDVVGFTGELIFNTEKPDGTLRKLTDVSKLHGLGWRHKTSLNDGLRRIYEWYKNSFLF